MNDCILCINLISMYIKNHLKWKGTARNYLCQCIRAQTNPIWCKQLAEVPLSITWLHCKDLSLHNLLQLHLSLLLSFLNQRPNYSLFLFNAYFVWNCEYYGLEYVHSFLKFSRTGLNLIQVSSESTVLLCIMAIKIMTKKI